MPRCLQWTAVSRPYSSVSTFPTDQELVTKLNAAIRKGRYSKDLWKTLTGHALEELGSEWRTALEKKAA